MNRTTSEYQIEAVAKTYHHWITGLTLAIISKKGASVAERFVFRLFRKQHLEKFIGGLEKLGLQDTPAAIACAKYHYFSNQLGGVSVEYLEESPKKAWIRYPPPVGSGQAQRSALSRPMLIARCYTDGMRIMASHLTTPI